jgi:hypothetical protein
MVDRAIRSDHPKLSLRHLGVLHSPLLREQRLTVVWVHAV